MLYMHPAGEKLEGDATAHDKKLEGESGMGRGYNEVHTNCTVH